jgi:hypothetical protein
MMDKNTKIEGAHFRRGTGMNLSEDCKYYHRGYFWWLLACARAAQRDTMAVYRPPQNAYINPVSGRTIQGHLDCGFMS